MQYSPTPPSPPLARGGTRILFARFARYQALPGNADPEALPPLAPSILQLIPFAQSFDAIAPSLN
ncbi:hypothetical protein [Microcoleus sp.]|uniref:hypothetical protein n=1 Tax=Microcoleus sp. TaxID=44472 RepID=UPI003594407C